MPQEAAADVRGSEGRVRNLKEQNDELKDFNAIAEIKYRETKKQFTAHRQLLKSIRGDLDFIFSRLGQLKKKQTEASEPTEQPAS